jgi:CDP-glucose 4,6-dehydratase
MEELGKVKPEFWLNKKVFLTGHTGFKGSWVSLWLQSMGATVNGFALAAPTDPALFIEAKVGFNMESEVGDIRDLGQLKKSMGDFNPDILIHMAAQPLVRYSYENPLETYAVNVMGTANVLESAKRCNNLKAIVSVTTDKCYENREWEWGYRENEPMGGHDPYSSSKGCAELVTAAYRSSFFHGSEKASVASARAGNVIGGGDWAADRLIPDILSAFEKNEQVIIRNPMSTRPWQHVLEPLSGYLVLAQQLFSEGDKFAEGWNFGPRDEDCRPVNSILDQLVSAWGSGASWTVDSNENPHEAGFLKLDCSKAANRLQWKPKWGLDYSLEQIVTWHQLWLAGGNVKERCLQEIANYMN